MASLSQLRPLALLGTQRAAWPSWAGPAPLRELLEQLTQARDAEALLRVAAVLGSCARAGGPAAAAFALPPPAPEDQQPALPDGRLHQAIAALWLLNPPPRFWLTLFDGLAAQGLRLPERWLPLALQLAERQTALRTAVQAVLGERGRWLQALRQGRDVATAPEGDAPWQTGSFVERQAWLRAERARDPAAARERLAASLRELPAKERAEFAALLAPQLQAGDEALLDSLRADRAQAVRQQGLALLLRLPQAAYTQRACARLAACLRSDRGWLGGTRWHIEPPAEPGADWAAEQIESALPKGESLGQRAWWLLQLVRQVPLAWWTQHTGMDAAALRSWAERCDWAEALLRGWREVLIAAPEADWVSAWLTDWPRHAGTDGLPALLLQLPVAQRELHWRRIAGAPGSQQQALLEQLQPGETLSAAFSMEQLPLLMQCLREPSHSQTYLLRSLGPAWLAVLHVDALRALQQGLPGWQALPEAQTLPLLAAIVESRLALEEFKEHRK